MLTGFSRSNKQHYNRVVHTFKFNLLAERKPLIKHLNAFGQCRALRFDVMAHGGAQIEVSQHFLLCGNGVAGQLG